MNPIDYHILDDSLYYYRSQGFEYKEVPWIIDEKISNITKPEDRENFHISQNKVLVASGEQSFLQLIHDQKLGYGKYVTLTPCFRDETVDETHKQYFMKTELMIYDHVDNLIRIFADTLYQCIQFFKSYTNVKLIHIPTNKESEDLGINQIKEFIKDLHNNLPDQGIDEFYTFDILDKHTSRELGSYGIRTTMISDMRMIQWFYGTGCAEPRLSQTHQIEEKTRVP